MPIKKLNKELNFPKEWTEEMFRWLDVIKGGRVCSSMRACIAGGCFRDMDHGKEIKDVDIFVYCDKIMNYIDDDIGTYSADHSEKLVYSDSYFGGTVELSSEDNSSEKDNDEDHNRITKEVKLVWEYEKEGTTYNVVIMNKNYNAEAFFRRLDFGLSRIGVFSDDPDLDVVVHNTYTEDSENKVLKIRRCENDDQHERSLERGRRHLDRYTDFTLVPYEKFTIPNIFAIRE